MCQFQEYSKVIQLYTYTVLGPQPTADHKASCSVSLPCSQCILNFPPLQSFEKIKQQKRIKVLQQILTFNARACVFSHQLCPTSCDLMDYSPRFLYPWNSPGRNVGVVAISFSSFMHTTPLLLEQFLPEWKKKHRKKIRKQCFFPVLEGKIDY